LTANLPKDIANKTVKNPQTGKDIKVTSALKYDDKSPVYKAATSLVQMLKK
jgi:nucleoid DNA-binding protein